MHRFTATDLKNLLIIFTAVGLMIVLYGRIDEASEQFSSWDLHAYRAMAEFSPAINPSIRQPFAYRILGPFLAGLLPVPEPTGFYILAILCSLCLVLQFYHCLRVSGLTPSISLVMVLLFVLNKYFFGLTLWDSFQLNDLISLNILLLVFDSLWAGRWLLFGIALAAGTLVKEVPLIMIPVALVYLLEQKTFSSQWRKAVAAALPGLILFFLLRLLIPSTGGLSLLKAFQAYSGKILSLESLFRLLVNAFLPLSLVPLIFFEHTWQFFRTRKYALFYICLVLLSTLFAFNNERLMAPVFIVFYWLIGAILQDLNPKTWTVFGFLGAGFACSLHHLIARWQLPNLSWTYIFTFGSGLAVTAGCLLWRIDLLNPRASAHQEWRNS